METVIVILLVCIFAAIIAVLLIQKSSVPDREELTRLRVVNEQKDAQINELSQKALMLDTVRTQNVRLTSDLEYERQGSQEKIKLLMETEVRIKTEFENLANRIFEEKGKTFSSQNKEKLEALLTPFKEQLDMFRRRVDEVHKSDTEGLGRLLEQVRQLQELNAKVSVDANNLAEAIKGDSKTQGNWGELIVERIFEASGLTQGREYEIQAGLRTEDNRLQKPDFIVNLPGDKAIIVDSKVSLTAYERYCNEEDPKAKQQALNEHVASVRKHIEELRLKAYQQLLGNKTLDFVIMCVPIEPAYQLALLNDKELIYDLARGTVVITGPVTLMITLKLIAQIWRRENENRNAELIADRGGKLYDQVSLVVDAMTDAHKKLDSTRRAFDLVMNRLVEGKGNLVGRVEGIKELGAKTSRTIQQEIPGRRQELAQE